MNYSIQKIKFLFIYFTLLLITFTNIECQYVTSRLIDNEPIIYKINDTIYFGKEGSILLKETNNKNGFSVIKNNTNGLVIEENKIFIDSNEGYFLHTSDTLIKIESDYSIEGIKPMDFYLTNSIIYKFE